MRSRSALEQAVRARLFISSWRILPQDCGRILGWVAERDSSKGEGPRSNSIVIAVLEGLRIEPFQRKSLN